MELDYTALGRIREKRPLVHCVSNIVTAADCANLALAVGASPMMAQAPEEMEEITRLSAATVLNTGTPDRERFEACRICGVTAGEMGQPVVLDPVGVGASSWRLREMGRLLGAFAPGILRVNLGEARALLAAGESAAPNGVSAAPGGVSAAPGGESAAPGGESFERGVDSVEAAGPEARIAAAGRLASLYRTTVLLTGETDVIHDGSRFALVSGGSGSMAFVTGAGCMLSVLCGAFAAVLPDAFGTAALSSLFWKMCAAAAAAKSHGRGIGDFRRELMNAAYLADSFALERFAAAGHLKFGVQR